MARSKGVERKCIVHVMGGNQQVVDMFEQLGYGIQKNVGKDFDMLCLTGGEDICPMLYGERPIVGTNYNVERDLREVKLVRDLPFMFPKVGICRGAQLLNVLAGGTLWQDVDGHNKGAHLIQTYTDKGEMAGLKTVTSTHHQQILPHGECSVLAAANKSTIKLAEGRERSFDNKTNEYDDVEVVDYWHCASLCYQPHPEYTLDGETYHHFRELLAERLLKPVDVFAN